MNIISRIHDGMQFFFTKKAVESKRDVIGFYFDGLGLPNPIHRDSIYGGYVKQWLMENNIPCGC